ncbi:IS4 family transposase [Microbulbifer sp. SSSA005]|uniref:IS4 family transposase n=2 Tax=unclassified Microbulbifer TaxID=2619833 RepID=UPI00403992F9
MQDWVMDEVKNQVMGDTRLNKRLSNILSNLSSDPNNSIPCANKTWAETFAAYRFIENDKVNFDSIMSGHKSATLERIKAQPVVLIPQDTTFLNFATDLESKEMGTLRRKETNQQLLHTSIAITPSRVNLGVVEGSMWQRDKESSSNSRYTKSIKDKESRRWLDHYETACQIQEHCPESTIVSIADREGDIHEWFQLAEEQSEQRRASYIVRAKANRTLELDGEETVLLWDHMNEQKSIGLYAVDIPKRNGEPGRKAKVSVSTTEIRLLGKGKSKRPLSLYAVLAKELNPPEGEKGIEWMLLTDLPVEDYKQARVIIEWYRSRWEIETYFRVVKGGCQIESNRFRTEQRMLNCIAIYMIIGWRLHSITTQAKSLPDEPCTSAYSEKEWRMVWMMRDKSSPPNIPPSMRDITRMLAGLGGFLGRKGDGEPGVKTVWQGYAKLLHYVEAAEVLNGLK